MGDDIADGSKRRRPRAELRELMIDAGVAVLDELGVEVQISSVSYARVFEHLERTAGVRVTYGSVHERIWDSLADYQLSVIERAGLWDSAAGDARRSERFSGHLAHLADLDTGSPSAASDGVREAWRLVGAERGEEGARHDAWSAWLETIVAMGSRPHDLVAEAARTGAEAHYAGLDRVFNDSVGAALRELGLRPNELVADSTDLFALMARISIAVADGLDLRTALTAEPDPPLQLRTGPHGERQEWNLYSVVMWCLTHVLFEPADPEAGPDPDR